MVPRSDPATPLVSLRKELSKVDAPEEPIPTAAKERIRLFETCFIWLRLEFRPANGRTLMLRTLTHSVSHLVGTLWSPITSRKRKRGTLNVHEFRSCCLLHCSCICSFFKSSAGALGLMKLHIRKRRSDRTHILLLMCRRSSGFGQCLERLIE